MNRKIASVAGLAALAVLHFAAPARADEIKLKDGSKIYGTIVGFEDNSFKVKTSYGFAVGQKDQVVSITVTDPAKQPEADSAKKPDSDAAKKPEATNATAKKPAADAAKKSESAAAKTPVAAATPATSKPEKVEHASAPSRAKNSDADSAANSIEEYPHTDTPTSSATNSAQPAPAAPSASSASNAATPVAAAAPPKLVAPEPM